MADVTEADKQEACDRANALKTIYGNVNWQLEDWGQFDVVNALAQAYAELRETKEALAAEFADNKAFRVNADKAAREAVNWIGTSFAIYRGDAIDGLRTLMLPDPEPDYWGELNDGSLPGEGPWDTAARLGLKLVKDASHGE